MCKRVDRLQRSEVIELRGMLEHSQKKYMELHSMLQEYLEFSQEEMERPQLRQERDINRDSSIPNIKAIDVDTED